MMIDTSWLPRPSTSDSSCSGPLPCRFPRRPKFFATCPPSFVATSFCRRDAAFNRLTSVLPSRFASTRFISSDSFSNSASRSRCSSTACSSGGFAPSWSGWFGLAGFPPASVVVGNRRVAGLEGFFSPESPASPGGLGCCELSRSDTVGAAGRLGCGFDDCPAPPWVSRFCPTCGPGFEEFAASDCPGCAACFNRSATLGIRFAEMSCSTCSISAHFSRFPTPSSGLRAACRSRSSPAAESAESRRPFARSAVACASNRRSVSGCRRSASDNDRNSLFVSCSCSSRSRTSSDCLCHLCNCSATQIACSSGDMTYSRKTGE